MGSGPKHMTQKQFPFHRDMLMLGMNCSEGLSFLPKELCPRQFLYFLVLKSCLTAICHIRKKFCSPTLDDKAALAFGCLCCRRNGMWWHYKSHRLEQNCYELVQNWKGKEIVQKKSHQDPLHLKPNFHVVFFSYTISEWGNKFISQMPRFNERQ